MWESNWTRILERQPGWKYIRTGACCHSGDSSLSCRVERNRTHILAGLPGWQVTLQPVLAALAVIPVSLAMFASAGALDVAGGSDTGMLPDFLLVFAAMALLDSLVARA